MKSKTIFLFNLFICLSLNAREIPFNYFYYLNKPLYNPAFAGIEGKTNISLLGNYQYNGFEDRTPYLHNINVIKASQNPSLQFAANKCIKIKGNQKIGFGFTNTYFNNALININHFKLSTNWQYNIRSKFVSIGVGLSNYYNKLKINGYKKIYTNVNNFQNGNDKTISNYNYDLGLAFYNPKNNFFVGISALDIHKNSDLKLGNPEITVENNPYSTYVINIGIDIELSSKLKLKPSALLKKQIIFDFLLLNANFEYNKKFVMGAGYSTNNDGVFLNLGYNLKKLNFNYGYNLLLSRILSVSSGIHNFGIHYQL
jgi:type IX secretion system PorP/SprF family membrane protein